MRGGPRGAGTFAVLACAAITLAPEGLFAASISWIDGNADWNNAASWSPAQVPTSADDVTIDKSVTVTVGAGETVSFNSLTLGDAPGSFSPVLVVTGLIASTGSLTVDSHGTLQQNSTQQLALGPVLVNSGGLLTHTANAATMAKMLNLAVSGDFNLASGANITLNGLGYAGGAQFQNGQGPAPGLSFSSGGHGGGGAGHGGLGGAGQNNTGSGGSAVDSLSNPADLGSGGAGGPAGANVGGPGGAGGGALLLSVSGTLTINGTIAANGNNGANGGTYSGDGSGGGGAGGTINLSAGNLAGTGSITANGGAGGAADPEAGGGGGGGRIAIVVTGTDSSALSIKANDGAAGSGNAQDGGYGTIQLQENGLLNLTVGDSGATPSGITPIFGSGLTFSTVTLVNAQVTFDTGNPVSVGDLNLSGLVNVTAGTLNFNGVQQLTLLSGATLQLTAAGTSSGNLLVENGAVFRQMNAVQLQFASVNVASGGTLTHAANSSSLTADLNLSVGGGFTVSAGGLVNLNALGYAGGGQNQNGFGPGGGLSSGSGGVGGGGGGHGGAGGLGDHSTTDAGPANDSANNPMLLGSGGGGGPAGGNFGGPGGAGGGMILLAASGPVTLNGSILANGANGNPGGTDNDGSGGGGAGGTINLTGASFSGTGALQATGGNGEAQGGGNYFGAAGGGGIIALTGCGVATTSATFTVGGGSGATGSANGSVGGITKALAYGCPGAPLPPITTLAGTFNLYQKDVTLTWSPPSAGTPSYYKLYRSTATMPGVAPSYLLQSSISATNFTDTPSLTQNTTLYYIVTSVDSNGDESLASNQPAVFFDILPPIEDDSGILWVPPGESYTLTGTKSYSNYILIDGTLNVSSTLSLTAPTFTVSSTGKITADGQGNGAAQGSGAGGANINGSAGGGGYGGSGGYGGAQSISGGPNGGQSGYGSITSPTSLGSGGGNYGGTEAIGGAGGGGISITATSSATVNGNITASGLPGSDYSQFVEGSPFFRGSSGGGSGGSIFLTCQNLFGSGAIQANGGGGATAGGGGGGGRISIQCGGSTFSGTMSAQGGAAVPGAQSGGAGTIAVGTNLTADNGGRAGATTQLPSGSLTFGTILSTNSASIVVPSTSTVQATNLTAHGGALTNYGSLTISNATLTDTGGTLDQEGGTLSLGTLAVNGAFVVDAAASASAVSVSSGGVVTHAQGNPGFNLSVSGDMTISQGGAVSTDGQGYSGVVRGNQLGLGPGAGTAGGTAGGGGYGGLGGNGSGSPAAAGGASYGSVVNPQGLGSAGGPTPSLTTPNAYGGNGGGAVQLEVTGTLTVNGILSANGLSSQGGGTGGGSGGTLNVTAGTLAGSGAISANGGAGAPSNQGGGGSGGRVFVAFSTSQFTGSMTASGGAGAQYGSAGTVLAGGVLTIDGQGIGGTGGTPLPIANYTLNGLIARGSAIVTSLALTAIQTGTLNVQGSGLFLNYGALTNSGQATIDTGGVFKNENAPFSAGMLTIGNQGTVYLDGAATAGAVNILSGGTLTHSQGVSTFSLNVLGNLTIASGAAVVADGQGYAGDNGPGKGTSATFAGGGGYGGNGGSSSGGAAGGTQYGSWTDPESPGSGGGGSGGSSPVAAGGSGGGVLRITVSGTLADNGSISSNGGGGQASSGNAGGGGSGGSIQLAAQTLAGSGSISANGGAGGSSGGNAGGGAGGRIAIFDSNSNFTGTQSANGGAGPQPGQVGTILSNGTIVQNQPPTAASPASLAQSTEQLTTPTQSLTATLHEQDGSAGSISSTGTLPGTVSLTNWRLTRFASGAITNVAILTSSWSATLAGITYNGTLEAMAFRPSTGTPYSVKGVTLGDIRGIVDGTLSESNPGSNTYDTLAANWLFDQILGTLTSGTNALSGAVAYSGSHWYQNEPVYFLQTNIVGTITGPYSGDLNTTLTHARITDPTNPHFGEGFATLSYQNDVSNGQGWAYTQTLFSNFTQLTGWLDYPLRGLMTGTLNEIASPRMLTLSDESLSLGQALPALLAVNVTGPSGVSPGQLVSYDVEVRNDGPSASQNLTVLVQYPDRTDFVSASSGYTLYSLGHFVAGAYEPVPFVRWDVPQLAPQSKLLLNYQGKVRLTVTGHEALGGTIHLLNKSTADQLMAPFVGQ